MFEFYGLIILNDNRYTITRFPKSLEHSYPLGSVDDVDRPVGSAAAAGGREAGGAARGGGAAGGGARPPRGPGARRGEYVSVRGGCQKKRKVGHLHAAGGSKLVQRQGVYGLGGGSLGVAGVGGEVLGSLNPSFRSPDPPLPLLGRSERIGVLMQSRRRNRWECRARHGARDFQYMRVIFAVFFSKAKVFM